MARSATVGRKSYIGKNLSEGSDATLTTSSIFLLMSMPNGATRVDEAAGNDIHQEDDDSMATLSNVELEEEIREGRLLTNADENMIEGASYQLRLGNVYYDLSEDGKRFELTADKKVLIKPGHRVVLITHEKFDVPPNLVDRVVSKGVLV